MKSFRLKRIYKAVQYTGENKAECRIVPHNAGDFCMVMPDELTKIEIGSWVVFLSDGHLSVYSDEDFKREFEEVLQ